MDEFLKSLSQLWPYLAVTGGLIGALIVYIYLRDSNRIELKFSTDDKRLEKLEDRVSTIEMNYIPRFAAEAMVRNTEEKFQKDHENIIGAVNQSKREVMDRLEILDARILDLIKGGHP